MAESWFLLRSGAGLADMNMAIDEALLHSVAALGQPVLRFYGWTEPAATFGYAQRFRDVSSWTSLRPLIRRPTGGGLVPHDADWTYSLVFPPNHSWSRLKAVQSYQAVHEWIHRAFSALGLVTQLAPAPRKDAPGQCFVGAERFDLLKDGLKIAGAAQRRNRQGLLIQGSIQPRQCPCARIEWEDALLETAFFPGQIQWLPFPTPEDLTCRADLLARQKYSQTWYNQRR
jgi:lipoyl(octanoyl) transferase